MCWSGWLGSGRTRDERLRMLTTLVVGGGPTGTEFAGEVRPPADGVPSGSSTGAGGTGRGAGGRLPGPVGGVQGSGGTLRRRPALEPAAFDCRRWLCRRRTS